MNNAGVLRKSSATLSYVLILFPFYFSLANYGLYVMIVDGQKVEQNEMILFLWVVNNHTGDIKTRCCIGCSP